MIVRCRTLFDITATGVKHAFTAGRLPFQDRSGRPITDHQTWMLARNQQRNWETLLQILSLRTQPHSMTDPHLMFGQDPWWTFEFTVDSPEVLGLDGRPYGQLEQDSAMVPMLIGLTETVKVTPMLIPGINIVFEPVHP